MPQKHRPKGCEPGEGCFRCRLKDCRYSGKRSRSEYDMLHGRVRETEGHGYMPNTHERSGRVGNKWHGHR